MDAPKEFSRIVGALRYDVAHAQLLAHDAYWDGRNHERDWRNTFLYRTPRGCYFAVHLTRWQGEQDRLTPLTEAEAKDLYERLLPVHEAEYGVAFPNVTVEAA